MRRSFSDGASNVFDPSSIVQFCLSADAQEVLACDYEDDVILEVTHIGSISGEGSYASLPWLATMHKWPGSVDTADVRIARVDGDPLRGVRAEK